MNNREKQIQNKFISLLEKYDLDEIDVNMLCLALNIKRQTFYYHYKNIYDLIYSIYKDKEILEPFLKNNLDNIPKNIFSFLFKDQEFNLIVLRSNANDVLKSFLNEYVIKLLIQYLEKYNLRTSDKKEISRFYGIAVVEECLKLFETEDYSIKEGVEKISYLFNDDILKMVVRKYQSSIY